jgi:hypothetical protein
MSPQTAQELRTQNLDMKSELAAIHAKDAEHPPFRLAIVYNEFQFQSEGGSFMGAVGAFFRGTPALKQGWNFVQTIQIFRAPNGACIENRLEHNAAYRDIGPEIHDEDIPKAENQKAVRAVHECELTADGEHYKGKIQDVDLDRTSDLLYEGKWIYHAGDGDEPHNIQYRILGIYDDTYRQKGAVEPNTP